ncbi:hypothetical protein B0H14DRAFT_3148047 [Mycena olivaceomarginata]|nr:hypothetical protein B0H14DRAFT_3148047 [Mycena olivaceomarginata]
MSSSLIDWTTSKISALYASQHSSDEDAHTDTAAQLKTDLDAIFAPDAEIHLNHALVDREKFKEFVESRRSGTTQVEFQPEDLIETPVEDGNSDAGSIVAGKITLVKTHKFRIRAAPAKTTTIISFSAKIKQNPEPQIVQLFQTSVDRPFKVTLPTPGSHAVDASAL